MEDKKLKFREENIEYKKGFKWYMLPYAEIAHAYLRIEEVKSRLCCGVASFDMHFLMLLTKSGELVKTEVSSRKQAEEMLEEIKKKNPDAEIGYKKPKE